MNDFTLTDGEYIKLCEKANIDHERIKKDPAYKLAVMNIIEKEMNKSGLYILHTEKR